MDKIKFKIIDYLIKQLGYYYVLVNKKDTSILKGDREIVRLVQPTKLVLYKLIINNPDSDKTELYFRLEMDAVREMDRRVELYKSELLKSSKKVSVSIKQSGGAVYINGSKQFSIQPIVIQ